MLQWRNWTIIKAKLFEFSLFNGNHEIVDEVYCFHYAIILYLKSTPFLSKALFGRREWNENE